MADSASNTNTNPSSSSSNTAPSPPKRRSSIAGETFANIFGSNRRNSMSRGSNASADNNTAVAPQLSGQPMGPITSAAANARRLSMGTFNNLSTSPSQSNGGRREGSAAGIEESAVEDEPASATAEASNRQNAFHRRLSSSTRAFNNSNSNPDAPGSPKEGFNWSDNFRTRAERTSSIAAGIPPNLSGMGVGGAVGTANAAGQGKHKSIAVMDSPMAKTQQEMPKQIPVKERPRPDHFQERILKGDFYMD